MLRYERESNENGIMTYLFFPEGNRNAPGKVAFYPDGSRKILQDSDEDFKRWYAGHALSGIDRSEEQGMVAWY